MSLADHLVIAPVAIPALAAPIALLVMRRHRSIGIGVSLASCAAMLVSALYLLVLADDGIVRTYALGEWAAPFGIELVADRLSAIMLVLASAVALIAVIHSLATRTDTKGWHFHPLFQFQMMGVNGAFLTGDLFNLFVFFEVLLIASYGLMLHGQGSGRLKAGVQYVIVNLVGSSLFLVALGLLYALTGTLNMADMGARVAMIGPEDQGLLRVAALLLISVFALKAALVPLHLWLPRTYAMAFPAVAALFALMTKVGVYSIIRVVPLVFGDDAGAAAWAPAPYLLPAAIISAIIGFAGVFVGRSLSEQAAFAVIGSTGTLLIAVAGWQIDSLSAALYYMVHSTLAGAALFLVADTVARRRGSYADTPSHGPAFHHRQSAGLLFMAATIAVIGLPPLSGFLGKLLILVSVADLDGWIWAWATILATTLIGVIGFARTGSAIFWKEGPAPDGPEPRKIPRTDMIAAIISITLLALLTLFAGRATAYTEAAATQILEPAATVRAPVGSQ